MVFFFLEFVTQTESHRLLLRDLLRLINTELSSLSNESVVHRINFLFPEQLSSTFVTTMMLFKFHWRNVDYIRKHNDHIRGDTCNHVFNHPKERIEYNLNDINYSVFINNYILILIIIHIINKL